MLDPKTEEELRNVGRLCSLLNVMLHQGTVPIALDHSLRDLTNALERAREAVSDLDPSVWVKVDVSLGQNIGGLLADSVNPGGVPDHLPEDFQ